MATINSYVLSICCKFVTQVAAEVSLEAKSPKPEEDLERRLSSLRGVFASKPNQRSVDSQGSHLSSLDTENIDFEEVYIIT